MKVKYIGKKGLLSVPLPIGNKRKPKETLDFTPGQEHDLKDDEAKMLVEIGGGAFEAVEGAKKVKLEEKEETEEKPKKRAPRKAKKEE